LSKPPVIASRLQSDLVGFQSEGIDEKRDQETEQVNPVAAAQKCPQGAYGSNLLFSDAIKGRAYTISPSVVWNYTSTKMLYPYRLVSIDERITLTLFSTCAFLLQK
jgi:hypothetical protein